MILRKCIICFLRWRNSSTANGVMKKKCYDLKQEKYETVYFEDENKKVHIA